jgi:hypothetical protein
MRMTNWVSVYVVALLSVFFVGSTSAAPTGSGLYVGAGAGLAMYDVDEAADAISEVEAEAAASGLSTTSDLEDNCAGWKVFAGYNILRFLAIETAYVDLGEIDAEATISAPRVGTGVVTGSSSIWGISLEAIASTDNTKPVFAFAKVGGLYWNWEDEATASITVYGQTYNLGSETTEDDGFDVCFGGGAGWNITDKVGVRVEYERFATDPGDVDFVSGSLVIRQ